MRLLWTETVLELLAQAHHVGVPAVSFSPRIALKMKLSFKRLHPDAKLPTRATDGSAGLDLYVHREQFWHAGELPKLGTGVAVAIPPGYVGLVIHRSSFFLRGLTVLGVVDSDYRGEILVVPSSEGGYSHAKLEWWAHQGERIAQLLVIPCPQWEPEEVEELSTTLRGSRGYGSTGR